MPGQTKQSSRRSQVTDDNNVFTSKCPEGKNTNDPSPTFWTHSWCGAALGEAGQGGAGGGLAPPSTNARGRSVSRLFREK